MEPPEGSANSDDVVVVFVGPSIDRAAVAALLPAATALPPICQGQLLSAAERYGPAAVAIIDGEFAQSLSVWHKEILFVLGQGVRVFGASSMGALRAAECDVYGMVGVGQVYEWYRDGVLVDDDEVALIHGSEDDGWRSLSWPMVNVRATIHELCAAGLLDEATAEVVLRAAKSIYFGSRTELSLAQELTHQGRSDAAALARLVTTNYRDQKRRDAELLLERLAGGIGPPPVEHRIPKERLGRFGSALRNLDTEVERPTGTVLRQQIVLDAALHEADFDELQERAIERALVAQTAQQLGHDPTTDELAIERERFLARRELTEASLPSWLAANDLDEERFAELLVVDARARQMRRWFLNLSSYERNCRPVTDQLRREGRYPDVADRAARRATLAAGVDQGLTDLQAAARRLVNEQLVLTDWRPSTPLSSWIEEHGFGSNVELLHALADASAARRQEHQRRGVALSAMFGDDE
jgi:hypothetical protein